MTAGGTPTSMVTVTLLIVVLLAARSVVRRLLDGDP